MICYAVNVQSKDEHLADRLIKQLAEFNPDQSIFVITDGFQSTKLRVICRQLKAVYIEGEKVLNTPIDGGKLTDRYMRYYLEYSKDNVLINIESAAYIWRFFNQPVPVSDIFGSIVNFQGLQYFKKGFCGYWRSTVKKTIASNLLLSHDFLQPFYLENNQPNHSRIVGKIATDLNFSMSNWNEIDIAERSFFPRNLNQVYAVTYPHD